MWERLSLHVIDLIGHERGITGPYWSKQWKGKICPPSHMVWMSKTFPIHPWPHISRFWVREEDWEIQEVIFPIHELGRSSLNHFFKWYCRSSPFHSLFATRLIFLWWVFCREQLEEIVCRYQWRSGSYTHFFMLIQNLPFFHGLSISRNVVISYPFSSKSGKNKGRLWKSFSRIHTKLKPL